MIEKTLMTFIVNNWNGILLYILKSSEYNKHAFDKPHHMLNFFTVVEARL